MKQIIILLGLSLLLTGCFAGENQTTHDAKTVENVVIENNDGSVESDEQTKEKVDNEVQVELVQSGSSDPTQDSGVDIAIDDQATAEEKQVEAEVIDEFEGDLDEIFKDLGV